MQQKKIIWLEDNLDYIDQFQNRWQKKYDYVIKTYRYAKGAIEYYKKNYNEIYGIISDAQVHVEERDGEASDKDGLYNFLIGISNFNSKHDIRHIPIVILSGQISKEEKKTIVNLGLFSEENIFRKSDHKDCLTYLNEQIEKSDVYRLEQKFSNVFEVFNDRYTHGINKSTFLKVLKCIDKSTSSDAENFNLIRGFLEKICDDLININVFPESIKNKKRNTEFKLSSILKFFDGDYDYASLLDEKYINPVILQIFESLNNIAQDGSHKKQTLNLKVQKYIVDNPQNYLLQISIYQLLEFMSWYQKVASFVHENEKHKKWYEKRQFILSQDDDGNYYTSNILLSKNAVEAQMERNEIRLGSFLCDFDRKYNTQLNKEQYKFFSSVFYCQKY